MSLRLLLFVVGQAGDKDMHIIHMTSAHPRHDTRIFHKECVSLAREGHQVHLIVADGHGDGHDKGVSIVDVGKRKSRFDRMTRIGKAVYQKALTLNGDVYHFHDPELLPYGWLLKRKGKKVIYDIHEDVPRQILSKTWIPKWLRPLVSQMTECLENRLAKSLDGLVCVTPQIADRFREHGGKVAVVANYPLLEELHDVSGDWGQKERAVCYVGGLSRIRGLREMVAAAEFIDGLLYLAGPFESQEERAYVSSQPGWNNVRYLGVLDRKGVRDLLGKTMAGLVLFHPEPNHLNASPNKMFEYMAASIPVISSDFRAWKRIIEGESCGVCVSPFDIQSIARAINDRINSPASSQEMGLRGRLAVEEKYSWEREKKALTGIYARA